MKTKLGIISLLLLWACAHVEAPKGGEPDKRAPFVVGIFPGSGQTNVSPDFHGVVQFNEWISDRANLSNVQISPPLERPLKVEASGDQLHIYSRAPLANNTTYTILVSRDIQDVNNNKLVRPFQLFFSTGKQLDTLELKGSVDFFKNSTASKPVTTIGLYPMGEQRSKWKYIPLDTNGLMDSVPNPIHEIPLYLTQSDSLGFFEFKGLAQGQYRIFAFVDKNKNRKPDLRTELIAISNQDLSLPQNLDPIFLTLANQDTSSFASQGLEQLSDNRIALRFNRSPANPELLTQNLFKIRSTDSLSTRFIHPATTYWDSKSQRIILQSDSLERDSNYLLQLPLTLQDSSGNQIDSSKAILGFTWLPIPDTSLYAKIESTYPKIRAKHINPQDSIVLFFDRRVSTSEWQNKLMLKVNGDTLLFSLKQHHPFALTLHPQTSFPPNGKIEVALEILDTIPAILSEDSVAQEASIDTLRKKVLLYDTWESMKLSGLKGSIPGCEQNLNIRLFHIESAQYFNTTCQDSFSFPVLVEGKYILDSFQDLDSNNTWSQGELYPYVPSEPFFRLADTLHLQRGTVHDIQKLLQDIDLNKIQKDSLSTPSDTIQASP